jgi:hypothetical protein
LALRVISRRTGVPHLGAADDLPGTLGAPLILRDGRRLWRLVAGRDGQPTEAAAALAAEAKSARVVTVADNAALSICIPAGYRGDLPARLAAQRADVLAELHRQSDERIGLNAK